MIPTVEDILLDLAAGKITVEQASAWMEEHFTLAMEQAISEARPEETAIKPLLNALDIFAKCDLHEGNCASLEVATRRIRSTANRALAEYKRSKPQQERPMPPHGCGDKGEGSICHMNLDGSCPLATCDYYAAGERDK